MASLNKYLNFSAIAAASVLGAMFGAGAITGAGFAQQWVFQGSQQTNNGSITVRSVDGASSQSVTQNPTGAAARVNQSAVTQPPVVVMAAGGSTPGMYAFFGSASCLSGWVEANGTNGTVDLRGEFIRGLDRGRGVDPGRVLGSAQLDQMQRITGFMDVGYGNIGARALGGYGTGAFSVSYTSGVYLNHVVSYSSSAYTGGHTFDSAGSPGARVSSTTSGETRARNVALLACMKT